MKHGIRLAATLSVAALCIGLFGLTSAHADEENWRGDAERHHINHDTADIRRDTHRLHDLEYRRDRLASRHDWRGVRETEWQITQLRRHIENDRRDIRRDINQARQDQYRESYDGKYRYHRGSREDYRNRQGDKDDFRYYQGD